GRQVGCQQHPAAGRGRGTSRRRNRKMPVVATNTAANSALRFLNYNSSQASSSVGKLASGSRIVKASDDAAGLAIGTKLKADVTVLAQAGVNASQGASMVQVADGGL